MWGFCYSNCCNSRFVALHNADPELWACAESALFRFKSSVAVPQHKYWELAWTTYKTYVCCSDDPSVTPISAFCTSNIYYHFILLSWSKCVSLRAMLNCTHSGQWSQFSFWFPCIWQDCSNPNSNTLTDLQVLLQTTQQLSVHVASLRHPQALLLGLSQPVLQDAAVLVGAVQFPSQLLQLIDLLLQVAVSHLLHLRPQLVNFILGDAHGNNRPWVQYHFPQKSQQESAHLLLSSISMYICVSSWLQEI